MIRDQMLSLVHCRLQYIRYACLSLAAGVDRMCPTPAHVLAVLCDAHSLDSRLSSQHSTIELRFGCCAGGTYDRDTLLKQPLGRMVHSLRLKSSSQQDIPQPYHPTAVRKWGSFDADMKDFLAGLEQKSTKTLFRLWGPSADKVSLNMPCLSWHLEGHHHLLVSWPLLHLADALPVRQGA